MKITDARLALLNIKSKRLESRIEMLEKELEKQKKVKSTYDKAASEVTIERYGSYLVYKYDLLRKTNVWETAEKIITYSRRSLFAARLIKAATAAVAIIETGAVFLLSITALVICIPTLMVIALTMYLTDLLLAKRRNAQLLPKIGDKKIIFLIAEKSYSELKNGYFGSMAKEFSGRDDYFVIIVTRSLKDGFSMGVKFYGENLVMIRESYYFRLKTALKQNGFDNNKIVTVH